MPTSLAGASPALAGFLSGIRERTGSRVVTLRVLRVLPLCERTLADGQLQEAAVVNRDLPSPASAARLADAFERWAWWDDTVAGYDRLIAQGRGRV